MVDEVDQKALNVRSVVVLVSHDHEVAVPKRLDVLVLDAVAEAQRQWQLLRRGRYLEFNLLNDRGVRFGLSPDAIERIMVSAPPLIAWQYKAEPEAGSPEARLADVLRAPRSWVSTS